MYLRANYATTERSVKPSDVVLVAVPGAQRPAITPTSIGQLHSSDSQWLHPGIRMLMSLGNSKNVAACIAENLLWLSQQMQESCDSRLLEIKTRLETLRVEAGAQMLSHAARAQLFLDYAAAKEISGIPYIISDKVRRGGQLSMDEASAVAKEVYSYLKKNKKAASFVKDGIRDYIAGGEADRRAMSFLATAVSPIFGEAADNSAENAKEQATLESEDHRVAGQLQQLTELSKIMPNGNDQAAYSKGLEAVVSAASAIKAGKTSPELAAVTDGTDFHLLAYQMIWLLTGAEPGQHFLCGIDDAAQKGTGSGMLVPFVFKAANGTNVPEEFRQHYLPAQDFASYVMVLDTALTKILLAYLNESRGENTGRSIHTGLVKRALSPNNRAVQILYPDELVMTQGNPGLAAEVNERALARFKNGEIAELAAKHMGLKGAELSQENLGTLVAVMDQAMPVLPVEIYQIASYNALQKMLRGQFLQAQNKELAKRLDSLFKRADKLKLILQDTFGINIGEMANYLPKAERTIALFGEGKIGFIRQVLAKDVKSA